MRDGIVARRRPLEVNPLQPVELVIDHSVRSTTTRAECRRPERALEFTRNRALHLPSLGADDSTTSGGAAGYRHRASSQSGSGPRHFHEQVNGSTLVYPDTTGGHRLAHDYGHVWVVGCGVGGIEAEAAMLGQPISMLIPEWSVSGWSIAAEGATATDLVLTITERLRKLECRQVRRILRTGAGVPDNRRSGDARQHVAGYCAPLRSSRSTT